jgi:hypothetical protein
MNTATKTLTLAGKKYWVTTRCDGVVQREGPGVVGGIVLPAYVALDSPDLRDRVAVTGAPRGLGRGAGAAGVLIRTAAPARS